MPINENVLFSKREFIDHFLVGDKSCVICFIPRGNRDQLKNTPSCYFGCTRNGLQCSRSHCRYMFGPKRKIWILLPGNKDGYDIRFKVFGFGRTSVNEVNAHRYWSLISNGYSTCFESDVSALGLTAGQGLENSGVYTVVFIRKLLLCHGKLLTIIADKLIGLKTSLTHLPPLFSGINDISDSSEHDHSRKDCYPVVWSESDNPLASQTHPPNRVKIAEVVFLFAIGAVASAVGALICVAVFTGHLKPPLVAGGPYLPSIGRVPHVHPLLVNVGTIYNLKSEI